MADLGYDPPPMAAARVAPTDVPIHPLLAARWSSRAVDPERPVAPDQLRGLFEAARWAPSSGNAQPWRFVVCDEEVAEARARLRACLKRGNAWAQRAPVLLALLVAPDFPPREGKPSRPNPHARYDAGAAAFALALEGTARGLAVHQMAGFDAQCVRGVLGLDAAPELEPVALIAVGHPAAEAPDPAVAERDARPRRRRDVGELVRRGTLNGPPFVG